MEVVPTVVPTTVEPTRLAAATKRSIGTATIVASRSRPLEQRAKREAWAGARAASTAAAAAGGWRWMVWALGGGAVAFGRPKWWPSGHPAELLRLPHLRHASPGRSFVYLTSFFPGFYSPNKPPSGKAHERLGCAHP